MNGRYSFSVDNENAGTRIDKFISENIESVTRNSVQKLIESGAVTVNSVVPPKNYKLKNGDDVSVMIPEPKEISVTAENIPLDIVYEDNDLLVVNKPKGMVVHPAPGNYSGTLVNALLYHCRDSLSGINGEIRPGIVHRIDKDTSGLLIVAKNDVSHVKLASQIQAHSFKREYEAVVVGNIKDDAGVIDKPLGRSPKDRKKQAVNGLNPRSAVTHYEVLERFGAFTHCRFRLETGRTHQIRVHLASIGHPVAGDTVYGGEKNKCDFDGQCLHARTIGFIHPSTGGYMEFTSELPEYFTSFLNKLNNKFK